MSNEIARIQLWGERNSGTHFLEHLLARNFPRTLVAYPLGWKHFISRADLSVAHDTLCVIIYRNPIHWALSMHDRPHHAAPNLKTCSFSEFIRAEWTSVNDVVPTGHAEYGQELMVDRHPETGLRFANLLRMRTAKLEAWLGLQSRVRYHTSVSYEELRHDSARFVHAISERFGLECTPEFHPVPEAYGRAGKAYRPKRRARLNSNDLDFICSELDPDLERSLGYDLRTLRWAVTEILERDEELGALDRKLSQQEDRAARLERALQGSRTEIASKIDEITESNAFRIASWLRELSRKGAPPGTWRRKLLQLGLQVAKER